MCEKVYRRIAAGELSRLEPREIEKYITRQREKNLQGVICLLSRIPRETKAGIYMCDARESCRSPEIRN